jgi:hypothetical protein
LRGDRRVAEICRPCDLEFFNRIGQEQTAGSPPDITRFFSSPPRHRLQCGPGSLDEPAQSSGHSLPRRHQSHNRPRIQVPLRQKAHERPVRDERGPREARRQDHARTAERLVLERKLVHHSIRVRYTRELALVVQIPSVQVGSSAERTGPPISGLTGQRRTRLWRGVEVPPRDCQVAIQPAERTTPCTTEPDIAVMSVDNPCRAKRGIRDLNRKDTFARSKRRESTRSAFGEHSEPRLSATSCPSIGRSGLLRSGRAGPVTVVLHDRREIVSVE